MPNGFHRRWIVANAWSEGIGLSASLLLGVLVGGAFARSEGPAALIGTALAAVGTGILFEGLLVGYAQARVLTRSVPQLTPRGWILATAIGAGIAWLLGMVPSTIIGLLTSETGRGVQITEPEPWVQYSLAVALGAVLGVVLSSVQAMELKRIRPRPWGWLAANGVAWAVGLPMIFIGMEHLPWGGHPAAVGAGVVLICVVVGGVVGAIHGTYLKRLIARSAGT